MEQQDQKRIAAGIRQLQILWLAFISGVPISAAALLWSIPSRSPAGGMMFTEEGLLAGLLTLPLAYRFRDELHQYVSGRVIHPAALQRTLVFGAITAEVPMIVGIVQFVVYAIAPALILSCSVSIILMLLFRPKAG